MQILHLSDLHFGTLADAQNWYHQLAEDLCQELDCPRLDALIISGNIAQNSVPEEYAAAQVFIDSLRQEFKLRPEQLVIVPGDRDLNWQLSEDAYSLYRRKDYFARLDEGRYIDQGNIIEVRDEDKYQLRFQHFHEFYTNVRKIPYPLESDRQATLHHFPEHNLLIVGFNSAWQIDHHYQTRASIHPNAVTNALLEISRHRQVYQKCLKIAVWHHSLADIKDDGFAEKLAKAGFRLALHGHLRQAENSADNYEIIAGDRPLKIIAAGTFGAPLPESIPNHPYQYNLLKIDRNQVTVYTRRRAEINGRWQPDARWLSEIGGKSLAYYQISL
jgi:3',5'-cyclic AMP phosphodiesterase CpdA